MGKSIRSARQNNRILWLTNFAAPYRRALWQNFENIEVALLETDRAARRDGRRGSDWLAETMLRTPWWHPRTIRFGHDERIFYILLSGLKLLRKRPASILIGGWDSPAYWQALICAKMLRIRSVGFYESPERSMKYQRGIVGQARKFFFRALDAVVVPGIEAEKSVLALGVEPKIIFRGFNSVDMVEFQSPAIEAESRAPSSIPEHKGHKYLYVGQLIGRKNVGMIISAFAEIHSAHDTLTIVGEGDLRDELASQIQRLGLSDSVHMIGYVPNAELGTVMAKHDSLVLISELEVWGLVVNEALAAGMNVVVSENCGVAASVSSMAGVYICRIETAEVAAALVKSREDRQGPIRNPEIWKYTPERFAGVFRNALLPEDENRHD